MVTHPLTLRYAGDQLQLVNSDEPARTQGVDAFARIACVLFASPPPTPTSTQLRPEVGEIVGEDFRVDTTMRRVMPLNPRHSLSLDLAHERENNRLIGVEARFVGRQSISDTVVTSHQPYVTIDARLEKHVKRGDPFRARPKPEWRASIAVHTTPRRASDRLASGQTMSGRRSTDAS